eukprot:PRCOL_00004209-RA
MKYLEYPKLARVGGFLNGLPLGNHVLRGVAEAYSCKLAGMDKKLCRSLEQDVVDSLVASPDMASSPVGMLNEAQSRRTLIYLILTLNHMYPDYDFTSLRAHHFSKEPSLDMVRSNVESRLLECKGPWVEVAGPGEPDLFTSMWVAIDEAIDLADCDIYSYNADEGNDPFSDEGAICHFSYIFYNKKLKRVLYFATSTAPKHETDQSDMDDVDDDGEVFDMNMDM